MFIRNHSKSRGDTMIEVLFATAVFGVVAIGSLNIMNKGLSTSQRALEIALVRQEIDAQAEMLRFLNSAYATAFRDGAPIPTGHNISADSAASKWLTLTGDVNVAHATISDFGSLNSSGKCPSINNGLNDKAFVINTYTGQYNVIKLGPGNDFTNGDEITPQVEYDLSHYTETSPDAPIDHVHGIWIEMDNSTAGSVDFHIRACWDSPGESTPTTLGTIVRLYVPS